MTRRVRFLCAALFAAVPAAAAIATPGISGAVGNRIHQVRS